MVFRSGVLAKNTEGWVDFMPPPPKIYLELNPPLIIQFYFLTNYENHFPPEFRKISDRKTYFRLPAYVVRNKLFLTGNLEAFFFKGISLLQVSSLYVSIYLNFIRVVFILLLYVQIVQYTI